jgi:hypothetical protein
LLLKVHQDLPEQLEPQAQLVLLVPQALREVLAQQVLLEPQVQRAPQVQQEM